MTGRKQVPLSDAAGGGSTLVLIDESGQPEAPLLVFGHGAGTSAEHSILASLASAFTARGLDVVRYDFPYRRPDARGVVPKRPPDRGPKLVACLADIAAWVRRELRPGRLFVGGHSMGGRIAAHWVEENPQVAVDGVCLCSYPLHPARRPERLRDEVLLGLAARGVRMFWARGTRDPLSLEAPFRQVSSRLGPGLALLDLEGVDHGYGVLKSSALTSEEVLERIAAGVARWCGVSAPRLED